jgi:hypothetical protein
MKYSGEKKIIFKFYKNNKLLIKCWIVPNKILEY